MEGCKTEEEPQQGVQKGARVESRGNDNENIHIQEMHTSG